MVGRPREFDENLVLEAAMQAFWAHGYDGTSMADLMAATGLHKGSIYQAFGDKHRFFLAALRRYLQDMRTQKREMLRNESSPLEGFRRVSHAMLNWGCEEGQVRKGCMVVNAIVELAPRDSEVEKLLDEHFALTRKSIIEQIQAAQDLGDVSRKKDPALCADLLMTFSSGLAASMKGPMTVDQGHQLLDAQVDAVLVDH